MHCEIIDCYSTYFFFVEVQVEKKTLKSIFWVQELGHPNWYTGLPNDLDTSLIIYTNCLQGCNLQINTLN